MFMPSMVVGGFSPLTAEIDDPDITGEGQGFTQCGQVTSETATIEVRGGLRPYSFLWELVGPPADGGPFTATVPTGQSTEWTATKCSNEFNNSEDWQCTVTDRAGESVIIPVSVTLIWIDLN